MALEPRRLKRVAGLRRPGPLPLAWRAPRSGRAGDAKSRPPCVDERHDGIPIPGDHQRRVGDAAEPGKAGPARGGDELPEEAAGAGGPLPEGLCESLEELRVSLDAAPVDGRRDAFQMSGCVV